MVGPGVPPPPPCLLAPPCPLPHPAPVALPPKTKEFHHTPRDRHTVLRWADFEPVLGRIAGVRRSREAYRALPYDQVRWDI